MNDRWLTKWALSLSLSHWESRGSSCARKQLLLISNRATRIRLLFLSIILSSRNAFSSIESYIVSTHTIPYKTQNNPPAKCRFRLLLLFENWERKAQSRKPEIELSLSLCKWAPSENARLSSRRSLNFFQEEPIWSCSFSQEIASPLPRNSSSVWGLKLVFRVVFMRSLFNQLLNYSHASWNKCAIDERHCCSNLKSSS